MSSIVIGKNIIELLTSGMYENPFFMYREYVQNSVDQIDKAVDTGVLSDRKEGHILIKIDADDKSIEIADNATGVSCIDSWNVLTSIAASEKDRRIHRGFRGIGRLGGLAYCKELVFETSFAGEPKKTIITWDAKKLRTIIANQSNRQQAHEVTKDIITFDNDVKEEASEHYFKVILRGVSSPKLLEVKDVRDYLSMVAPVPIDNKFILKGSVYKGFIAKNIYIDEYNIYVNHEQLYKKYNSTIYEIVNTHKKKVDDIFDIQFIDIKNGNEQLAYGWYGVTNLLRTLPSCNLARGVRLRKGNIQVGDSNTLRRFFKDSRFHHYFVGEIHVLSPSIIPNGRRDYFDENDALSHFESEIAQFVNTELHKLTRDTSDIHSSVKMLDTYKELQEQFQEKIETHGFVSKTEFNEFQEKLDKSKEKADKAIRTLDKIEEKARDNTVLGKILKRSVDDDKRSISTTEKADSSNGKVKVKWQTEKLSRLSKKEQKLVSEVYEVIRTVLPPDLAQNVINKISDKLK
jgi:molecular chaperone HtpG